MNEIRNLEDLLGWEAEDSVTGFRGVIVKVSKSINGISSVEIEPKAKADGSTHSSLKVSVIRVRLLGHEPVSMPNLERVEDRALGFRRS